MQTTILSPDNGLDLAAAKSLSESLIMALQSGKNIDLDCKNVERVTTYGLQLLLSAIKSFELSGLSLRLLSPSQVLHNALNDLGLDLQKNYGFN